MHSNLHHSTFLSQQMLLEIGLKLNRKYYGILQKTRSIYLGLESGTVAECSMLAVLPFADYFSFRN